ncbi:glycosyltransferase family 2 protein [Paenibacillus gansuensis]|uniref:Glycosyltransferase family 2 protein n=1 Tax=Paenibacillus gansuensis TaxID=306542 RepID=A0ABW5PB52_9BACL
MKRRLPGRKTKRSKMLPGRSGRKGRIRTKGKRAFPGSRKGLRSRIGRIRLKTARKSNSAARRNWTNIAYEAGLQEGSQQAFGHTAGDKLAVNRLWAKWFLASEKHMPWAVYQLAAKAFLKGIYHKSAAPVPPWVLLPVQGTVGAVLTVMNEEDSIPSVSEQLARLPLDELVIVVNGTSDRSFPLLRSTLPAVIVHYAQPLGHDVGRSVGAKLTTADIVLFLDGDFAIQAEHLVPFVHAVQQGSDLALNNITPYLSAFMYRDNVTVMKEFVNRALGRADLHANSLTAVPHALSRRAIEELGCRKLMIPPAAQTAALQRGLRVTAPSSVDVITRNKLKRNNAGSNNLVAEMIVGDHLEGLQEALEAGGSRLSYGDQIRNRTMAEMKQA